MKLQIILLLVLFTCCQCGFIQKEGCTGIHDKMVESNVDLLPDNLFMLSNEAKLYIGNIFPGANLAEIADYENLWWSFYDKSNNTLSVSTDINDDQIVDYAVIIRDSENLRLLFLIGNENNFIPFIIEDFSQNLNDGKLRYGIMITPPGQIDVITEKGEKSLILPRNAISLYEYEKLVRVYYWERGEIKSFDCI